MDLPEAAGRLKAFKRSVRRRIVPVSTVTGEGLEELKAAVVELLSAA
jgi:translation initiation factor IF-2